LSFNVRRQNALQIAKQLDPTLSRALKPKLMLQASLFQSLTHLVQNVPTSAPQFLNTHLA
jgi:hypothetical protein